MRGIYKFTCLLNQKSYIGQSTNIMKRFNDHRTNHLNPNVGNYNSLFYRALRKHGFYNFSFEVLEANENFTIEELNSLEIFYIEKYSSYGEGYNSTKGGEDNPSNNPEVVKKRTEKLLSDPIINEKLRHKGEKNPRATLTDNEVYDIRQRYLNKELKVDVYNLYKNKVNKHTFDLIWQGQTWKDIAMDVYEKRPMRHNGGSKLNEDDIRGIRLRKKNGEKQSDVYLDYCSFIGSEGFRKIWNYYRWKDIVV